MKGGRGWGGNDVLGAFQVPVLSLAASQRVIVTERQGHLCFMTLSMLFKT